MVVLKGEAESVYAHTLELVGGEVVEDAFLGPQLLRNDNPLNAQHCHEVEAFGPVATLMPYDSLEEAIGLTKMGKG